MVLVKEASVRSGVAAAAAAAAAAVVETLTAAAPAAGRPSRSEPKRDRNAGSSSERIRSSYGMEACA